jgi:ferrochelatase
MSAIALDTPNPARAAEERPDLRIMTSRRAAVILFSLGGPDSLAAVRPFLFNLFNDRAIVAAPQPFRFMLAQLISRAREKQAKANYAEIGGRSPLVAETRKQGEALEATLSRRVSNVTFRCFPAMRYWRPFVTDAAAGAEEWGATDAILLPLYPQFSSTTTGSSLAAWKRASNLPCSTICCYPAGQAFAQAHADAIMDAWRDAGSPPRPRVLFSAHGLPQGVVDRGDPYQWQGRARRRWRHRFADCLRVRARGDAGRTRYRICAPGQEGKTAFLSARASAGRGAAFH